MALVARSDAVLPVHSLPPRIDERCHIEQVPMGAAASVNTPHPGWWRMKRRLDLIDDSLEGQDRMLAGHIAYLPQYEGESTGDYVRRVNGTVLFPGFQFAVERLAMRPFAKPVAVLADEDPETGKIPELPRLLSGIEHDVDGHGMSLTSLAQRLMVDGVARGFAVVLVSNPTVEPGTSIADQERLALRPRLIRIPPRALFGWAHDGDGRLSEVRWCEIVEQPVGEWGIAELPMIHVVRAAADGVSGIVQSWAWNDTAGRFELAIAAGHDFPGLPIVVIQFGEPVDSVECAQPLYRVATLGLRHLRSSSRQTQYIESVRIATRFLAGAREEELASGLVIGPNRMMGSVNPEARLSFVEHSGSAAATGWEDLDRLEQAMAEAGSEPLRTRTGTPTATARAIDAAKSSSDIEMWVRRLETGLERAYAMAAQWSGAELPPGFRIDVWSDFSLALTKLEDADQLRQARAQGDLTRPTYLRELRRRGLLHDSVDPSQEDESLREEEAEARRDLEMAMDGERPA